MAYEFSNTEDIFGNKIVTYIKKNYSQWEGSPWPLTINIWVRISSPPSVVYYLCGIGNERDTSRHQIEINSQRRLRAVTVDDEGTITSISSSGANLVPVDTWTMATYIIFSSNDRKLYLNGTQVATTTTTRSQSNINILVINGTYIMDEIIHSPSVDINNPSPVRFAEFALWQKALSSTELLSLYSGMKATQINPQDLISYIPMIGGNDVKEIQDQVDGQPIHVSYTGETLPDNTTGEYPTKFPHLRRYG